MGNVFITSLSVLNLPIRNNFKSINSKKDIKINSYKKEGRENTYTGLLTNEASTYVTMDELQEKGEKIDKIILICTNTVQNKTDIKDEVLAQIIKEQIETSNENEICAKNYYIASVIDYINENNYSNYGELKKEYDLEKLPSLFKVVSMKDNPKENDIYECIVKVVDNIDEYDKLYIDINGGYRDVNAILLALCRVLKVMRPNVEIESNIYIPFTIRWKEEDVVINSLEDRTFLFSMFDLISGIDEFSNYGSVKKLNDYYKNKSEVKILNAMNEVSNSLKLCFSDKIVEAFEDLRTAFQNYEQSEEKINEIEKFLFDYLKQTYKELLAENNDDFLMKIINWCLEHEMIQPALCLCVEQVPDYLSKNKIFYMEEDTQLFLGELVKKSVKENEKRWYFIFTNVVDSFKDGKLCGEYLFKTIFKIFGNNSISNIKDEFETKYEKVNKFNDNELLKKYIKCGIAIHRGKSKMKTMKEVQMEKKIEAFRRDYKGEEVDEEIVLKIVRRLVEDYDNNDENVISELLSKKNVLLEHILKTAFDMWNDKTKNDKEKNSNIKKFEQYRDNVNRGIIRSEVTTNELKEILKYYFKIKDIRNSSFHCGKKDSKELEAIKKDINTLISKLESTNPGGKS